MTRISRRCDHERQPVRSTVDGEHIADLCTKCDARLDPDPATLSRPDYAALRRMVAESRPGVRLNVLINDDTANALIDLAERKDVSVTEIVRRAVSIYEYLAKAQDRGETIVLVEDHRWRVHRWLTRMDPFAFPPRSRTAVRML